MSKVDPNLRRQVIVEVLQDLDKQIETGIMSGDLLDGFILAYNFVVASGYDSEGR